MRWRDPLKFEFAILLIVWIVAFAWAVIEVYYYVFDICRQRVTHCERTIWAIALWVESIHDRDGWFYIAQQQDHLLEQGKDFGAKFWALVGERFNQIERQEQSRSRAN